MRLCVLILFPMAVSQRFTHSMEDKFRPNPSFEINDWEDEKKI